MDPRWKTSTRCASGGCVAVMVTDTAVHLGDTKLGTATPVVTVGRAEFAGFVKAIKDGVRL